MSDKDTHTGRTVSSAVGRRGFLATAGLAGSAVLAGCTGGDSSPEASDGGDGGDSGTDTQGGSTSAGGDGAPEAFRIGGTGPLTGPLAPVAESVVVAYRVIEQWVEDEGGVYLEEHDTRVPLEFTLRDDESDKQRAANLYRQMIQGQDFHMVIGPLTTTITSSVAPIIEENGIPMISGGAGTPSLFTETAPEWGYSVITPADKTSLALMEVIKELAPDAKVGEIRENERVRQLISDTCHSFAEDEGIDFETLSTVSTETEDFSSTIAEARSKDVDWLFANLTVENAALCLEQAAQVGGWEILSSHKIGQADVYERVGFENLKDATGFTAWNHSVDYPNAGRFVEDYRALFEERNDAPLTPDFHAAYGAIALQALLQTFQASDGYAAEDFKRVLDDRTYEDTLNGDFSFDEAGIVTPDVAYGTQLKGNAESPNLAIIWPDQAANAESVYPM